MKSYGKLWEKVIDEENILAAWHAFRRQHSTRDNTRRFQRNATKNLAKLRQELCDGTWQPSRYHQFKVLEPKPRIISSVPVRDRVVHHALCNIIAPVIERRFIDQSYACRVGKGSHLAAKRARELAGEYRYFLKFDIRHYFDSVDHEILLEIIGKMFREKEIVALAGKIVKKEIPHLVHDGVAFGRGLPIGNLTSQWFANLYLDALDHYVVEQMELGRRYLRYMDDFVAFFETSEEAWEAYYTIREWLWEHRRLELKETATVVAPTTEGLPFLGLRIFSDRWRLKPSRMRRTQRSIKRHYRLYVLGECDEERLQSVVRSMDGAARYFGFKGIYSKVDRLFFDGQGGIRERAAARPQEPMRESGVAASPVLPVIRGGNYNNDAGNCSSAGRNVNNVPGNVNGNIGARVSSVSLYFGENGKIVRARRPHPDQPAPGERAGTNMHEAGAGAVSFAAQTTGVAAFDTALPGALQFPNYQYYPTTKEKKQ